MSTGLPILMTPETGSREFHVKWGEAGLNSLASQRRVATRRLNCAILLFFMAWVVKFPKHFTKLDRFYAQKQQTLKKLLFLSIDIVASCQKVQNSYFQSFIFFH